MSDVIQAYVVRSDGKAETHTRLVVLATNHQRKYDALAAENARLREALTRARDKIRECVTAGVLRHDLNVFLTKEWDGAPDQPPEERT